MSLVRKWGMLVAVFISMATSYAVHTIHSEYTGTMNTILVCVYWLLFFVAANLYKKAYE